MKKRKNDEPGARSRTNTKGPSKWTFFTNHAHVLITLRMHPNMVLREIALLVGVTERAVQKIVGELETEGFIKKVKVGRRNQYKLSLNIPLRHPIEKHRTVAEVLKIITDD